MTAFTPRTSTHMGVDRILTSVTVTALYNNLIAAFEGDPSATSIGLQLAFAAIKSAALATQAQMEAENASVIVQPNMVRFNPGVCKAWVMCDANQNISVSYNCSGVTDLGTGILDVTWGNDFSSGNYVTSGQALAGTATTPYVVTRNIASGVSSTNAEFRCFESSGGTASDPSHWSIAAHGDQ